MAGNLSDLATELRAISPQLSKAVSDASKEAAIAIVTDLATVTPVDTSKALSNWRIGINQRPALAINAFNPGKQGSTQTESAQATIEAARLALATKKPGDIVWISNVLPYIDLLNKGSSTQAPAGFVERAVLIGRKMFERVNIKLKNG
jgi:hypothetical protein